MIRPNYLRALVRSSCAGAWVLGCFVLAATGAPGLAQTTQPEGQPASQPQPQPAQNATAPAGEGAEAGSTPGVVGRPIQPTAGKRQVREAEDAYLAGAKKLEHDDLDAAEAQFQRALKLDPENRNYAIAISVAREHRVTELVQQAARARLTGDQLKANTLLAKAEKIDPDNPVVLEHSGPFLATSADAQQPVPAGATLLADHTQMLTAANAQQPWRIEGPTLAGAIRLAPADGLKSFHMTATSAEVIRRVALAFGIRAVIDDSVENKTLHYDLDDVTYQQAMNIAMSMGHTFAVPVDEATVVVAKDDMPSHTRFERQLEETIFLPGLSTDQINDLASVVRTVFDVKQTSVQTGMGGIVVRAPQDVLEPMNRTLKDLMDGPGEVMVEVKLYEVDTTNMNNIGGAIPTQFSVFNVDQTANAIVSGNQALVQQAVAQGLVPPGTSNLEIALALIKLGLVQSSLASNLIGVFGGGIVQTGISASTNTTFNLALNTSDSRTLDDIQLRVGDRQPATFREGNKYPIVTSTYSSGISTAAGALGSATINGVSVASLLSQYAGGSSATIPQVTYEDLGITLKATPVIQKSGRINLLLDLKIEALSGNSLAGNPILESRQFATDLTVGDGESAMMVSNVTRNETSAMTGVPGLSELPGFQMPLQDTLERDRNQLVVVVTPHVVRRRSDMIEGPRIPIRGLTAN
jgi:general secretion pathway protein D